jgi:hypothetical protein
MTAYIDIGHDDPSALVWIFQDGRVQAMRISVGNHEQLWGMNAMNFWRGRYSPRDSLVSVIPPVHLWHMSAPSWLKDALEQRFGVHVLRQFKNPKREEPT